MGMTPRRPQLFSAKYQYITSQGSMMVITSPELKERSSFCSPNENILFHKLAATSWLTTFLLSSKLLQA